MLHLLGYDHQDADQEKIMFDLQDQILDKEKK
jgi:probable rRNA maturation factor